MEGEGARRCVLDLVNLIRIRFPCNSTSARRSVEEVEGVVGGGGGARKVC